MSGAPNEGELGRGVLGRVALFGSLIKFSHSIFAAPFALAMFAVVARDRVVTFSQLLWIALALVAARSAAMGWNRWLDRSIDAKNPRTAGREIPRGAIPPATVLILTLLSAAVFVGAAAALGSHCLLLSPLVLGVLFLYSWTKRFTSYSHLVLGLCLAMAPGGVWYAVTAEFAILPVFMMVGVLLWVAGFDILYACQDLQFDRAAGLYSIPARFGAVNAFRIARVLHLCSWLFLVGFGAAAGLSYAYFIGVLVFGWALLSQHRLVTPSDLTQMTAAFFTRNGIASCAFFLGTVADFLLLRFG